MILFVLAVLSIVVATDVVAALLVRNGPTSTIVSAVIASTVITLLVIGGGTASKMVALRGGGAAVANSVGAVPVDPSTQDPRLRRYVNIVEEMSIASGVPTPRLFVLEKEPSINAFAAGYTTADAAITATAGSLDKLNRDELQGVIGHEFSHILNGDMRLNVRLIGLLNGILLLGLVGLRIIQFGGGGRDRRGQNPLLIIAIVALVLGFVGQFFAGLIKAGVSRQREWLADASSVQFTRQTTGLAGALKKIATLPEGSALNDAHAEKQVNHMLFGEGARGISQLYATHPPLLERIKALEPTFVPAELEQMSQKWTAERPDGLAEDKALGLATGSVAPAAVVGAVGAAGVVGAVGVAATAARPTAPQVTPAAVTARVGTFTVQDLEHGAALSNQIPAPVRQAATQPSTVVPLLIALMLDAEADLRARQLAIVAGQLGKGVADSAAELGTSVQTLPELLRLPVVSLTAVTFTARPPAELDNIMVALDAVAAVDDAITLYEYCETRLLHCYVRDARDPHRRSAIGRGSLDAAQGPALALLTAIAAAGNADQNAAQHAYAAAALTLNPGKSVPAYVLPPDLAKALDSGWDVLDALAPREKQRLVEAVVVAVCDDGVLEVAEAELLRITCALLHCPLPALLT